MRSLAKRELATCTVPADAAQLALLTDFLREFWSAASLASTHLTMFELALEEVFTNIVLHSTRPGEVLSVDITLAVAAEGVTMTIEDEGPPFDPLSLPPPDVDASLDERPVGGLGVFLVRQMMDAVSYHRVGTRNRLTMTKYQVR